jgi:hypothetical protein
MCLRGRIHIVRILLLYLVRRKNKLGKPQFKYLLSAKHSLIILSIKFLVFIGEMRFWLIIYFS